MLKIVPLILALLAGVGISLPLTAINSVDIANFKPQGISSVGLELIQGNTIKAIINPIYEEPRNELKDRALQLDGKYGGQCVVFVRQFMDIFQDCNIIDCEAHAFRGYAGDIEPNASYPKIGSAILFEGGHTAVIIDVVDETLELAESNYGFDEIITVGRIVTTTDSNIKGYFYF